MICPDCGKEVSQDTVTCPDCGHLFIQADEKETSPEKKDEGVTASSLESQALNKWRESSPLNKFLSMCVLRKRTVDLVSLIIAIGIGCIAYFSIKSWNTGDAVEMTGSFASKLTLVKTCTVFCVIFAILFIASYDYIVQMSLIRFLSRTDFDYKSEVENMRNSVVYGAKTNQLLLLNDYFVAAYACEHKETKSVYIHAALTALIMIAVTVCFALIAVHVVEGYMINLIPDRTFGVNMGYVVGCAVAMGIAVLVGIFGISIGLHPFRKRYKAWITPNK